MRRAYARWRLARAEREVERLRGVLERAEEWAAKYPGRTTYRHRREAEALLNRALASAAKWRKLSRASDRPGA